MESCQEDQFFSVLSGGRIKTVYQPIVSLRDGGILGYEALSRVRLPECELNIEQLFSIARRVQKLWELEKLCRTAALESAVNKPRGSKLFLNVDPNLIHDPEMRAGFTHEKLLEYGLDPDDLVFEITERSAIGDMDIFASSIGHYQQQNFKIAIDDFGAGYSGLSRVCALRPNYIKLDIELVRDIHRYSNKSSLAGSIVKFCREMNISLIAEGVEKEEELDALIRLGVEYGQGFYLGKPEEAFAPLPAGRQLAIAEKQRAAAHIQPLSVFGTIDSICQRQETVDAASQAIDVYRRMQSEQQVRDTFVLHPDGSICGILTRGYLFDRFGGQFGYNLSRKHTAGQLALQNCLQVERSATIDDVARLAMERDAAQVYDSVAVTDRGSYYGAVSVRDLLMSAISIQVQRAAQANPLTGLPGNTIIEGTISSALSERRPFSVIYLDLDNFKAYNDAYGFPNGDKMIKALADTIGLCWQDCDLKGHVGGDDFVVVSSDCRAESIKERCGRTVRAFAEAIRPLYCGEDWDRGYIVACNRHGCTENFPIATLSVAVVIHGEASPPGMGNLSRSIAEAKKRSKRIPGNSLVIL